MAIHGIPLGFVEVVTNIFSVFYTSEIMVYIKINIYIYVYIYVYIYIYSHHVGYLPQNSPEKF